VNVLKGKGVKIGNFRRLILKEDYRRLYNDIPEAQVELPEIHILEWLLRSGREAITQ